jgi:hypothetical protein
MIYHVGMYVKLGKIAGKKFLLIVISIAKHLIVIHLKADVAEIFDGKGSCGASVLLSNPQ